MPLNAWLSDRGEGALVEPAEILPEVRGLQRLRHACEHYHVDLHVHSPRSADYAPDDAGARNATANEFVMAWIERGFDLIAITDHNSGAFVDAALAAAEEISATEGKNIRIIPGVEMYVSPGVHVLGLLPTGGTAQISDLLSRLGMSVAEQGKETALITRPIAEVAEAVHSRGGIIIAAHCSSTNGLVEELDGQTRLDWLREVDALEMNSSTADAKIASTIDYVRKALHVDKPFTFGSDSHNCLSPTEGMWVKMAAPEFGSLRQFVFEPELRISRVKPTPLTHGRILGLTTTRGLYAGERFRFSPHLNVLIGGRGAGKSAVIDLIRFAFEAEPRAEDPTAPDRFGSRIAGFLQSVGEVLVTAIGVDGELYAITREGSFTESGGRQKRIQFTSRAKVYQVVGSNLVPRDLHPSDVLPVEFFGQGEAARLADRVDHQLRLLDENLDLSELSASVAASLRQLDAIEDELLTNAQRLESLQVDAAERAKLETRRDELAKSLSDPIFDERGKWDRERDWLEAHQRWLTQLRTAVSASIPAGPPRLPDLENLPSGFLLVEFEALSASALDSVTARLSDAAQAIDQAEQAQADLRGRWEKAFDGAVENYRKRLAEIGADSLASAAEEQRDVGSRLSQILSEVLPEIEAIRARQAALTTERTMAIAALRDARSKVNERRRELVEHLNGQLGELVRIDLDSVDTSIMFEELNEALQGSGMQRREEQLGIVCDAIDPADLVSCIRNRRTEVLEAAGLTEGNASRLLVHVNEALLLSLERVDLPPRPRIRIKREQETKFTDLSEVSVGEKCSAILSIALLNKAKPLVIDQPEDDLDHAFVTDSIVQSVRRVKLERQIIAATHNPNIPVLGDAEMVFRVARRPGNDICFILQSGGLEVDAVTAEVQGLEGGPLAFERRRLRYARGR